MPSIPMPKAEARQKAIGRSGMLATTVNEKAGNLRSLLRLDPLVNANLELRWGAMWHKDRDKVNWVRRNYPETAPVHHAAGLSFGYSGGEGCGRPSNRFGRIARRFIPGQGWVEVGA